MFQFIFLFLSHFPPNSLPPFRIFSSSDIGRYSPLPPGDGQVGGSNNTISPLPTVVQECGKCCPLEESGNDEDKTSSSEQVFWTPWWRPGNKKKISCSGLTRLHENHLRSFMKTWSWQREARAWGLKLLNAKYRFTEKISENFINIVNLREKIFLVGSVCTVLQNIQKNYY